MITDNEKTYLYALGFDVEKGIAFCVRCGNTYETTDAADDHWMEIHNPF